MLLNKVTNPESECEDILYGLLLYDIGCDLIVYCV